MSVFMTTFCFSTFNTRLFAYSSKFFGSEKLKDNVGFIVIKLVAFWVLVLLKKLKILEIYIIEHNKKTKTVIHTKTELISFGTLRLSDSLS